MKTSYLFSFSLLLGLSILMCSCEQQAKDSNPTNSTDQNNWSSENHQAVKAAITDYLEGLYQADSTRILNSVDSSLRKLGYWYNPQDSTYRDNLPMTHSQLVSLASRWNKDGSRVNEHSPKEIEIFDINSKTASAKLTAEWGIDYFHLGKVGGKWKIYNVIWQSMPEKEK